MCTVVVNCQSDLARSVPDPDPSLAGDRNGPSGQVTSQQSTHTHTHTAVLS